MSISPWKHERRFHFEDQETDGRLRRPIPAEIFGDYLASQQDATRADVSYGTTVTAVRREEIEDDEDLDGDFILETKMEGGGNGEVRCRTLVWAAGQTQAHIPAAARDLVEVNTTTTSLVRHYSQLSPDFATKLAGKRVLIIGSGESALETMSALSTVLMHGNIT